MFRTGIGIAVATLTGLGGCCHCGPAKKPATAPTALTTRPTTAPAIAAADPDVVTLFDGKTLDNWKATEFGGEAPVEVKDGQILVGAGSTLSGVTYTGPALPKVNYEIELDAMKINGSDFFLALTFPYKKEAATFVLGGWGGSLVGISSVNGNDAANNEFSSTQNFEKKKWYKVRLRATDNRIQGWINDEQALDVDTTDKEINTRADIDLARPLGLSTFQTAAAYKNVKLRKL